MTNSTLYGILQKNLGLPSKAALQPIMKEISSPLVEGEFRWKELSDYLDSHGLSREIWVGEDGTRIVARVEYDPSSNQIIGFAPKLNSQGCPEVKKFDASTAETIISYFSNNLKSNYAYVIMAQPLSDVVPAFCLCVFGTNNKFSAGDVLRRWEYMKEKASSFNIILRGFSSDADTRLLCAMRVQSFPESTNNPLIWYGWYVQDLDQEYSYIQDTVHIGTKMRTRFLKDSIILPMGNYVASPTHLRSIIEDISKLEHGLTNTDLKSADKMNFKAVLRMTDSRVLDSLNNVHGAAATHKYLQLMSDILVSFLDKNLTASQRIFLIWKSIFFIRVWRKWLEENEFSTSTNFLTSFTYFCLELNAHALIALVRKFRNEHKPAHLMVWLFSSQCNENFFRILRSFTPTFSTIVNVSMRGFLGRCRKIHLQTELIQKLEGEVVFPKVLEKISIAAELSSILSAQGLPSDEEICLIVKQARIEALSDSAELGMKTAIDRLVPPTSLQVFNFKEKKSEQAGQNGEDLPPPVPEDVYDDVLEDTAIANISTPESDPLELPKTGPFLKHTSANGRTQIIRKSTFLWLLSSGHQNLSSDRLVRVQTKVDTCQNEQWEQVKEVARQETIRLGDWCVFKYEGDIVIGRVLAFSYLSGKGKSMQYSSSTAPTTKPMSKVKGLGCLCSFYELSLMGQLLPVKTSIHEFYDIDNYLCSIPRPQCTDGTLRLSAMVVGLIETLVEDS
ncbi:tRNA 5-methylaminomethyl-2-thiouridine biosynthesis bifunctional protein MnmC [Frankliniella fusca]|uniref:tRNA 5-methylaminomethyl-2-thiouridine biosynthesis bifunctional protein MnmC n=1 Tax=Frankliniella fusca TaxID=407009 RepID=A0AAE1HST7_9NEOP|nr:tRNA 5-methylaminomethyl-2-thiouridine biosynthesis bifunctional protein MnmC [Frankliniella fusca]KAK3926100.1 tRNA 5-methylaminomethyl-2-thiouridine biosynthesis bifunctional protein MnmC [Frankliniella fusca]KAK3926107.1 tRNA 5-methylaminomethyl-2-thiouridine biosynthesis bifunctional protein MnmC [Frankliniella fusca]